jgi:GntR family transcriptional regulator, histidine utilization repressor
MSESRLSWKDVRDRIHGDILSGRYGPGDRMPRDADFAVQFACARTTVARAMKDLSDSGLIERRRKGGTRVRADPVTRGTLDIPVTRLEVERKGGNYAHQIIARETAQPPRAVLATFGVASTKPMLHLRALHLSDARPYILEDRWVCLDTAPEIADADLTAISANEWLVRNKPYDRLDMRFYAIEADAKTADLMEVEQGAALLVIERTTWIAGAPITTVKSVTAPGYQLITRT